MTIKPPKIRSMENDITKEVALKILERHNDWRRGKEIPMLKPESIGLAIDKAIEILRQSIINESKKHIPPIQNDRYFCCKDQIEQRCSEQCLGCFQFENTKQ